MCVLVRWRAWWFNKVPLSITMVLLLLDGERCTGGAIAVLVLVVLAVCAVGNYGYALNDLFDVGEDERAGRANAAADAGSRRMWAIVALSAVGAVSFATVAAGAAGAWLTALALALPAAYSIPPLRVKERAWLGVAADALAAHVYPAALALLAVAHWALHPVGVALAISAGVWSAAAGVRGILSHQLHTAERDAGAGLQTVVHAAGAARLERFIVAVLLPLEALGFAGILVSCRCGPIAITGAVLYVLYELYKTRSGWFRVTAFRPQGQPYLPLVEESFYKAWGPLVVALDAARIDPLYLLAVPAYAVLFKPHLAGEWNRLRAVMTALRAR